MKYCYEYKYSVRRGKFSTKGKAWIEATKRCLQEALLPYMGSNLTSEEFKAVAFATHTRWVNGKKFVDIIQLASLSMANLWFELRIVRLLDINQKEVTRVACSLCETPR